MAMCPHMPMEQGDRFSTFDKPILHCDGRPEIASNPPQIPRMLPPAMPPPNPTVVNKEASRMFFKTRLCVKFQSGSCPYGNTCNFAHGPEELRRPPPNWQEIVATHGDDRETRIWGDRQRNNKFKLCRKFYRGEVCPYGDDCTFLHERPGMVGDRESSVIRVGTTESPAAVMAGGADRNGFENPKSNGSYQKTKTCHKWETTGYCPYGNNCIFLHGSPDLKKVGGAMEVECPNTVVAHLKHLPKSDYVLQSQRELAINHPQPEQQQKGFLRWKVHKRINRIYGDWLDDLQPGA